VAAFGQILRGGRYTGRLDYADVVRLARYARGGDPFGYRGEFINLAGTAAALAGRTGG
jgi:Ca-activated chloride channel homolog